MSVPPQRPAPVLGVDDSPLWHFAAQGELRLQRCAQCGHVRYLPAPVCPHCLSEHHEWSMMSGRGRIASWCVFHRQYFPELPPPYTVVMVEIDEGPVIAGNILDCPVADLRLDLPVVVAFEPVCWSGGGDGVIFQWRRAV